MTERHLVIVACICMAMSGCMFRKEPQLPPQTRIYLGQYPFHDNSPVCVAPPMLYVSQQWVCLPVRDVRAWMLAQAKVSP